MKIIYIGNSIIPDEFILFSLNFFISPNDRGILTKKKDEKKRRERTNREYPVAWFHFF